MKPPIDGLKVSPGLALITLLSAEASAGPDLYHQLARQCVNVTFMTLEAAPPRKGSWQGSCCVREKDLARVRPLLAKYGDGIKIRAGVAALTLFPHKSRPGLLDVVLGAFLENRIPLYAMGSSLSTLIFATSGHDLDKAVAAVVSVVQLPANHAPFVSDMRVCQI